MFPDKNWKRSKFIKKKKKVNGRCYYSNLCFSDVCVGIVELSRCSVHHLLLPKSSSLSQPISCTSWQTTHMKLGILLTVVKCVSGCWCVEQAVQWPCRGEMSVCVSDHLWSLAACYSSAHLPLCPMTIIYKQREGECERATKREGELYLSACLIF